MMDISIHTKVFCSDGLVGKSTHIIVDLVTEQVTHVVIKTKESGREYLVPLEMVSSADREAIHLNCKKDEIAVLNPFHEAYFNVYDSYSGAPPVPPTDVEASHTLYHPYRTAETGAEGAPAHPSSEQQTINKGAVVLATDGDVGKIDELVIEPETHRVTHLVLRQHHLTKDMEVTIPVSEIERVEMGAVNLKIDKEEVASLPTVTLKKYPWE
jgi:sporulation protein YlmC with PRC-barrel domain